MTEKPAECLICSIWLDAEQGDDMERSQCADCVVVNEFAEANLPDEAR
jgi:hypothetical protein